LLYKNRIQIKFSYLILFLRFIPSSFDVYTIFIQLKTAFFEKSVKTINSNNSTKFEVNWRRRGSQFTARHTKNCICLKFHRQISGRKLHCVMYDVTTCTTIFDTKWPKSNTFPLGSGELLPSLSVRHPSVNISIFF
jgi:hypothetical protein